MIINDHPSGWDSDLQMKLKHISLAHRYSDNFHVGPETVINYGKPVDSYVAPSRLSTNFSFDISQVQPICSDKTLSSTPTQTSLKSVLI